MAKDEQWRLVDCVSAIYKLSRRVDDLEAVRNLEEARDAAQNLRQQDEDVEGVAAPRPMDADLLRRFQDARGDSLDRLRAVYDLGRKHGATQATCPHIRKSDDGTSYCSLAEKTADSQPTPNDDQIRSSAPAVGLMEMLADVWSEGKPLHPAARRAAIRKVAEWLELQQEVPIGCSTASADYFSDMLREEADR